MPKAKLCPHRLLPQVCGRCAEAEFKTVAMIKFEPADTPWSRGGTVDISENPGELIDEAFAAHTAYERQLHPNRKQIFTIEEEGKPGRNI